MKKVLAIAMFSVLIWSCSKKMTPTGSETPASTSMSNNNTPFNNNNNAAAATTTTTAASASTTSNGQPTGARVATASTNDAAVAGQSTYNAKCGRCHGLKVVQDYTADRWISIMQVMAPKAGLSETEKANVLEYVKANAKRG
jgi:mono/diheme cytochrome c family protein